MQLTVFPLAAVARFDLARSLRGCLLLFVALALAFTGVAAHGGSVPVTNTNNGLVGSLRQAIQDAPPGDTIVFQIPTSDPGYNFGTNTWTVTLTGGELIISKNLTIDGGGQKIWVRRVSGNFRNFNVTTGTVTISGLTISHGKPAGATASGGGVLNDGNLTVRDCTFLANDANTGSLGGGIRNRGTLRVSNSTFYGNLATSGSAISNEGALRLDNSTISGNQAHPGTPAPGGPALYSPSSATARVRNTIIVGNTRGSTPTDVAGTFISEGYNLIGDASQASGFDNTGDQIGATPADANLSPLQDNGGPTQTMRPYSGSVAIDKGKRGLDENNQLISADQRGEPRPVDQPAINSAIGGDGSDIGAVENGLLQAGPTFTVTNTTEHNDGCTADDCTLLEAMNVTNANDDANTINFAPGLSGVILNTLVVGGLNITNPVTINGPGARILTISGNNAGRIFNIAAGDTATISGLTIAHGNSVGIGSGGGIFNSGTLTLLNCAVLNNSGGSGGGAANAGTLTINNCTFGSNQSTGNGGAVRNTGVLHITNSTFYLNSAFSTGAISSFVNSGPAASVTITNSTVCLNYATDGSNGNGGGLFNGSLSTMTVANSIIANNDAAFNYDVSGTFSSLGSNFIGNKVGSTGFEGATDHEGNPGLDTMAENNGGPTDTFALLASSTARDAGNNANAPSTDQRGFARVGVSDIGAYEFGGTPPPPVPLLSAVSRKVHGAASFDINLPLTGNPGIECRSGDYKLIFSFANPLTSVGGAFVTTGTGSVSSHMIGANTHNYIVNLTGVSNAQLITVSLTNVNDSAGNSSSSVPISMGVLIGDTTGNGSVNASDIGQTKSKSGQAVNASNFRTDVTVSGSINSSDIGLVKSKSGTSSP